MDIVISKDGGAPYTIPPRFAPEFFRAFRDELRRSGTRRDPQAGDTVIGVTIVSLTLS